VRPFTLGTMYWTNPNYDFDEMKADLQRVRENNISLIRCFIWWEKVERVEGEYDFSPDDRLFAAAKECGLDIMATIGFYPPMWLVKKLEPQNMIDPGRYPQLDRPEIKTPLGKYVRELVGRYKDSSALKLWNIWNEPSVNNFPSLPVLEKFAKWLKARYQTHAELINAWKGEHNVFDLYCPNSMAELTAGWLLEAFRLGTRGRTTTMRFDYQKFTMWNLSDQLQWLASEVKAIDPLHPTHTNPCSISINQIGSGHDYHAIAKTVDTVSSSIHHSHDYIPGENVYDALGSYIFSTDQTYCWTMGKKPTWVGELQAGTTICHARKYTPDAATITSQLWHALGSGLDGVVFWEWQSWRAGLFEVGEFSLRNASDGAPTERSEAAAEFGRLYAENADVFLSLERPARKVAIMYPYDTFVMKGLQEDEKPLRWHSSDAHFALFGCHRALTQANIDVDFISENCVEEGLLGQYAVLYLPGVEVMRAGVAERIREFVANGGAVYADGRLAFLDDHMFLRHQVPGHGLSLVFGAKEADFVALPEFSVEIENRTKLTGHLFAQYLQPLTGEVEAKFSNGRPAVIDNRFGKGKTRLVGTGLCRRLRDFNDIDAMQYIADFALEAGVVPALSINQGFVGKRLCGVKYDVLIVTNTNANKVKAEILEECQVVQCLQGGGAYEGKIITRDFDAKETAVFILTK